MVEKLLSYKENIENGKCPYCGSNGTIDYSYIEIDYHNAIQRATCTDCEKSWREIYDFKRVVLDEIIDAEGDSPVIEF